jgi:two-component system, OmpR family, response regulator
MGAGAKKKLLNRTQVFLLRADITIVPKDQLGNVDVAGTVSKGLGSARASRAPARRRSSILIVDDDDDLARKYQRALESYGYAVERTSHGEAAISLAAQNRFDVVVGDIYMRDNCESETLKSIHEQCEDLPVVLLSSGLAFSSVRAAMECGAHRYLLKPVSEEHLLEVLVKTIQQDSRPLDPA